MVPEALQTGTGSVTELDLRSLFWLNNLVANQAYSKWELIAPIVTKAVNTLELQFLEMQDQVEGRALEVWHAARRRGRGLPGARVTRGVSAQLLANVAAGELLSNHSTALTAQTVKTWLKLWKNLTVTYRDGCRVLPPSPGHDHGGKERGGGIGNVEEVGWRDDWKREIVAETGDHFKVKTGAFSFRQEARKRRVVEGKHVAKKGDMTASIRQGIRFLPEQAVVA